jgi:LysR family transcriptional regulator, glycine cleavage system transcriptional activator
MRKRQLPPLNALRGFEAAARHLSFTKAAEELLVTQGAVSRQIRDLEIYLGQTLFRRLIRRIELTEEGSQLFLGIEDVFDEIERAAERCRKRTGSAILTISVLPTIASVWLMPRLHRFTQKHRDIDVRIVSSIEPADLLAHEADIAIRVGRLPGRRYDRHQPRIELEMVTTWAGVHADELFPDNLVPVCRPHLIRTDPVTARDIAAMPLIHTTTRRHAWPDWLRVHDARVMSEGPHPHEFGHFFMSLDAARGGLGVAIVPNFLFCHYEFAGELCVPIRTDVASAGEYYLLIHESRLEDPTVMAFRSWLLLEAVDARLEVAKDFLKARSVS